MASAQEKQKKGAMYIYNMDTGNINHHTSDSSANTKKPSLRGGWGLRRSKTIREVNHPQYGGGVNAAGQAKTGAVVERRKSVSGSGEARKSVSCIEVNATSVAAYLQAKVLVTDMPAFMQVHAFRCARQTFDNLDTFSSKQLACSMKKEFDKVYGPAWHCIVGSSFGSFVTHSTGCFLYFSMEKQYILVFKTKVLQLPLQLQIPPPAPGPDHI